MTYINITIIINKAINVYIRISIWLLRCVNLKIHLIWIIDKISTRYIKRVCSPKIRKGDRAVVGAAPYAEVT